jgi:flavin reductase (DIM6/NTAB) family NADH-FMN oxidoreductase RutF
MENFTTINPDAISTAELHNILLTAVAPRPIALASTINEYGKVNLSPFSFFNVFSANPPILIFSPARRVRDNSTKHTLDNVKKTKEVVINIVNFSIVEQISLASSEYDAGINEFLKSGLTEAPSVKIAPPRVLESPVAFECIVDDIIALGNNGGAGNLVLCRVVFIHINNKYLNIHNQLDTKKLDLVARMGANWYTRCTQEAIFEIPKPLNTLGIGVDQLPKHIYRTSILTGNDLGKLGIQEKIPSTLEINEFKLKPEISEILTISNEQNRIEQLHKKVKDYIHENKLNLAIKTIYCI